MHNQFANRAVFLATGSSDDLASQFSAARILDGRWFTEVVS